MLYIVLEVRHEHEVAGLEPAVVQGMMVYVTQDGPGPQPICHVLSVDVLAQLVHQVQGRFSNGLG